MVPIFPSLNFWGRNLGVAWDSSLCAIEPCKKYQKMLLKHSDQLQLDQFSQKSPWRLRKVSRLMIVGSLLRGFQRRFASININQ
jgi:hypothetical protein